MAVTAILKAKGAMNGSGLAAQLWEKQAGYWWNDKKHKNPSRKTEGTPKDPEGIDFFSTLMFDLLAQHISS